MLELILGKIGAGKTVYAYNLIKKYVNSGTEKVILIVPEQYSFSCERALLDLLGPKDADKAEVFSFTRMAERFFDETGAGRKPFVSKGGRTLLMSLAIESVSDRLEIFSRGTDALTEEMLRLSDEFKQCAVTPDELARAAEQMEQGFLKSKTGEIALIISAYNALLKQKFSDDKDLLTEMYEALGGTNYFKNSVVVIDSFKGFTRQEYKIIERILTQAEETCVTLCADTLNSSRGSDVFAVVRKTGQKLMDCANRHGVKIAEPVIVDRRREADRRPASIAALEAGLYSPAPEICEEPDGSVSIVSAVDRAEECAFVARTIKRLVRTQGLRYRDFAVIARDMAAYEAPLRSALKKCGAAVFEDTRQPVIVQPLISLARHSLNIAANGFSLSSLMACLKTGLSALTVEEISQLENYAIMWKINGRKWLEDFTMHPKGYGAAMTPEDEEALAGLNSLRRLAVEPLEKLRRELKETDGSSAAKALYLFLKETGVPERLKQLALDLDSQGEKELAGEQERVWDIRMSVLDDFASVMGSVPVTAKKFSELFDRVIALQSLGNIPTGLDEITVGEASRVRLSSPKVTFAVGVNDGIFPAAPITGGMLTDSDRKALQTLGINIENTCEYQIMDERFTAYAVLCSPEERLYVTYSMSGADGSELSPSELVSQIKTILPSCPAFDTVDEEPLKRAEGYSPAFELMCELRPKKNKLYASLEEIFSGDPEYAGRLDALNRAADKLPFRIDDPEAARELFGKNMNLSASVIESFYRCPFAYFCRYGLRAAPVKPGEFDAMQQGNTVHKVLENLLTEHGIDELEGCSTEERKALIDAFLKQYLEENLGGAEKSERFTYLYNRLVSVLNEVLERLLGEFSQSSFRPVDFELKIDGDGDIEPYVIQAEDGSLIRLRGSVDRVDSMERNGKNYIRIVDYKSGVKEFSLSDVMQGLNMQMLLYLYAVKQNGGERYGDIVPSGILYMPANARTIDCDRNISPEELRSKKTDNGKMSGMILDDDTVILGMEKQVRGVFMPVREKDGKFSGSLISLETLGKLEKRVRGIISRMAVELHRGEIPALPAESVNYKDICRYCEYLSVCGHENDSRLRRFDKLPFSESLKQLVEQPE